MTSNPNTIYLHLADRSIKYYVGIPEDVPYIIGQLHIPTEFIVMDIDEVSHIQILLGTPFLSIVGAIIDVKRRKLTFEVRVEKIEFILSNFMKKSSIGDSYGLVDIIDECVKEYSL